MPHRDDLDLDGYGLPPVGGGRQVDGAVLVTPCRRASPGALAADDRISDAVVVAHTQDRLVHRHTDLSRLHDASSQQTPAGAQDIRVDVEPALKGRIRCDLHQPVRYRPRARLSTNGHG